MQQRKSATFLALAAVALTACADDPVSPAPMSIAESSAAQAIAPSPDLALLGGSLDEINQRLAERGANFAVARAEYALAASASGPLVENAEHTIFTNNRQLRLSSRWVPGDARRAADGNNITFVNFAPFMGANGGALGSEASIDASFATWDGVQCSKVDLVKRVNNSVIPSNILSLPGFPNAPFAADISTIGFLPGFLFDAVLGPGASNSVLGVTFTFVFGTNTPGGFVPSDVDGDGRNDTALKEVWYNDAFEWTTDGAAGGNAIDIETVALHENGHALELGHFGMIHATFNNGEGNNKPGRLHVSPRAVMNAVILGTLRAPLGTDNSSYCGNFGSWPQ